MKLVTCFLALVFSISTASSGCVKFKHMVRSDAANITVTVSNLTNAAQNDITRDDYHLFQINSFTGLELITQTMENNLWIALSYDDIFPITDGSVCRSVVAESRAGGCTDGGCCVVALNAHCVYDEDNNSLYIVMRARTNIRNDQGTHEFWICEHEFHGTQTIPEGQYLEATTADVQLGSSQGDDCYEDDVLYIGITILLLFNVDTAADCQDNCQDNDDCMVWVFVPFLGFCFLREQYWGEFSRSGVISGPQYCPDEEIDIDECAEGTHDCDSLAFCTDTEESYNCTCNTGYTGDGYTNNCADIDECLADPCQDNAFCFNTEGSYTCICYGGFYEDAPDSCADTNECDAVPGFCHNDAFCNNTEGGYTCTCNTGFDGDGLACTDINECDDDPDLCHNDAYCTNTDGSYTCTCDEGLYEDATDSCEDIDECGGFPYPCHYLAYCTNTWGDYTCTCNEGYIGDGVNFCIEECGTSYCNHRFQYCNTDSSECENKKQAAEMCTDNNECVSLNCDLYDAICI